MQHMLFRATRANAVFVLKRVQGKAGREERRGRQRVARESERQRDEEAVCKRSFLCFSVL